MLARPPRTPLTELAALLAPVIGRERSEELLHDAARSLSIEGDQLEEDEARSLLDSLCKTPGLVGSAAALAKMRRAPAPLPASEPTTFEAGALPREELVRLLAHSLGLEKSDEVILGAARELRLAEDAFNREQALAILSILEREPGAVGTTARFAKARAILRFRA